MDKRRICQIKEQFDLVIHSDNEADVEYWYARELMVLLVMRDGKILIKQFYVLWIRVKLVVLKC